MNKWQRLLSNKRASICCIMTKLGVVVMALDAHTPPPPSPPHNPWGWGGGGALECHVSNMSHSSCAPQDCDGQLRQVHAGPCNCGWNSAHPEDQISFVYVRATTGTYGKGCARWLQDKSALLLDRSSMDTWFSFLAALPACWLATRRKGTRSTSTCAPAACAIPSHLHRPLLMCLKHRAPQGETVPCFTNTASTHGVHRYT